jgi:hypothetical protein
MLGIGRYIETRKDARTLPDKVRRRLKRGTEITFFPMPGYGVPDTPITARMRRDCFTCDLGTGTFDILPLWKRGCSYYGQHDGRRDNGWLAESIGSLFIGGKEVYSRRIWRERFYRK